MIWADHRELGAGVIETLRRRGSEVEVKVLPVGDYVIDGRVFIERKTTPDFLGSLRSGRLFRQVASLARCGRKRALIIEGLPVVFSGGFNPDAVRGALVSLAVAWQMPVLYAESPEETAWFLEAACRQLGRSRDRVPIKSWPGKKPAAAADRKRMILESLPGIGPVLAGELIEKFDSLRDILAASEQDLRSLKGIGKKKSAEIRDILREAKGLYSPRPSFRRAGRIKIAR